jgi:DNA-binding NarL/FixJ family response regulator
VTKQDDEKKARILIVDDHPVVRYGLTQLIQDEPDLAVCGEAADAGKALELVQTLKPDLVLIDISLKGAGGMELIKAIKTQNKWVKMLVHSMHDESLFAERALHAGALGYVNKEEAQDKIIEAIRQVLRGHIYLSGRMTERMMQRVMTGKGKIEESPISSLSDRELEVFELIGKGLSTREIADKLHLSVKTVETYRDHIKTKLGLDNNTELIRQAILWTFEQS